MQQQMKYSSTQPSSGNHGGSGFGIQQSYQNMQNAKLKNQKNYQAKVQKARRLGSSQGIGSGQGSGQVKPNQVAQNPQGILNLQQLGNTQTQMNNMPSMFHQNYKTNVVSSSQSNQTQMVSGSNPPSGGNSRSKSVHQQANSTSNVYGLVANQTQQNTTAAATTTQPSSQGQPGSALVDPPTHTSNKSHHFTSSNPIAIDPYNPQQSPQITGFNYNQSMNVPPSIKHHPKTAKQQRSLSDHFGGTRRQPQGHSVNMKQQIDQQASQQQMVNQTKKATKHQTAMSQTNKSNLLNVNQNHQQLSQMQFQQRINASQAHLESFSNPTSLLATANGQNISQNQKQMQMNTQKFQNSSKGQKDTVGSQKMISLNSKLQGIYKQYKSVGATGSQNHGQPSENITSPKDFAYMTQNQHNQKQQNNTHAQMQKQLSQSGQIQYNIGTHSLIHDGGRNMSNRVMSYQPPPQGSNQTLKSIDGIPKNQQVARDRSPNSTVQGGNVAGGMQSQTLTHMRSTDFQNHNQPKIAGHNLKSQSMHQIPPAPSQQQYPQNKLPMFDQSASQSNFLNPATNDLSSHPENSMKRQQNPKLVQVHSVAHLASGEQTHATVRVPSGKRNENLTSNEPSRDGQRTNLTQQQVTQRQGTPSNKHRRMSPKIQGIENNAQIDSSLHNSRTNHVNTSHTQNVRIGNQEFQNSMTGTNQGYNSQPLAGYHGQRHPSQDSKAQVSAAPASGVNSNLGGTNLIDRQGNYMDTKSLVGLVNSKPDGSNSLSQSIKQIPIRQVKVRNQAGSFVEASRSFNLSLKDSQGLGKIDKMLPNDSQTNFHQRGQSHQNVTEVRQDHKILADSQSNKTYHQRKEARIPSATKKRTASGSGLNQQKRVPSGNRMKQGISEQPKPLGSAKQQQKDEKKQDIQEIKDEQTGNGIFKPRSSINTIRRSRNEGKNSLPDQQNSDMLDPAGNPTSAGQSTSSLYKQEQINKKFKFQENSARESQKPSTTPKENKNQDQQKSQGNLEIEEQGKQKYDQTKSTTPQHAIKRNKSRGGLDSEHTKSQAESTTAKDKEQEKSQEGAGAGSNADGSQERKNLFNVAPNTGLSGRNLYFNQIRSEINLSESGKCKSLPDYQNAKYSNKRNGLVAGYGANTNQGIVRNYNEDRVAIILNIMKPKSKNYESQQWPKCSFFGIYDGHGGAVCADFLRDYLHQFIIKDENFPQNPIQALRNGFREAERLFMEFAESQEKEAGEIDRSGSCAVVILIIDDMCYCANTGDSRAIMSADGGEKLFLLSTDHKPTDEIEMKRIIEQGGRIYQNSQVIQTNPSLGEVGKQMVYGPHRVFPGRLSVSRTIGDIEAKIEKYEGNANVVIADPDVTAFEIKDNHDFIVIGCDGVFDKLSSKDAIHIAWQKVLMEAAKSNLDKVDPQKTHQNCGHCVDGILRTSALRRTVDNVTCVVVAFDGFQKQLQKFISNNQDGTTVDVIEEIQLEPIPEYLSNTKMNNQNKKIPGASDNSMLLLDDNQAFTESENPLIGGRNLRGAKGDGSTAKKGTGNGQEKLLSEIAEEDDVSSVSENQQNKMAGVYNKMADDTLGRVGKGSIHSITDKSINENQDDQASLTEREVQKDKNTMEQKRRSQVVPQYSAGQVGNNAQRQEDANQKIYGDSKQLDDVEVSISFPKKQNR